MNSSTVVRVAPYGEGWFLAFDRSGRAIGTGRSATEARKEAADAPACACCGEAALFDVAWLAPAYSDQASRDSRPACSSACAWKLRQHPAGSEGAK